MKQQREGREGASAAKTDQLHTTEQLLIMAPFLSWTKWGLFELLWSLETASRICTHVSLLCSYCSRFLQFSGWNTACLYMDQQAIRSSSIKLVRFLLIFMAPSGNSKALCAGLTEVNELKRTFKVFLDKRLQNFGACLLKFKMILHRDEAEFLGSNKNIFNPQSLLTIHNITNTLHTCPHSHTNPPSIRHFWSTLTGSPHPGP